MRNRKDTQRLVDKEIIDILKALDDHTVSTTPKQESIKPIRMIESPVRKHSKVRTIDSLVDEPEGTVLTPTAPVSEWNF